MTEQYSDSQVFLEPRQYAAIAQVAHEQDRTIPEVVQEVVHLGLEALQQQRASGMEALGHLIRLREEIYQTHGMYPDNIVAEVRIEREKQIERVLQGES